jgi:hypothetical protein
MVAPVTLVGDVHAFLALTPGGYEGAVAVDEGLLEELLGLLPPDREAGLVEDTHQALHILLGEAAAEISGGRGVRNALGSQGIKEDLVLAPKLDVLQARPVHEGVVGDVEDVIRFPVRQMDLEEVQLLVDPLGQLELLDRSVNEADPARAVP